VSGGIEATTTNGGVDVDLTKVGDAGVKLGCTNGGIKLRLPSDARATISASVSNGGIEANGLQLDTTEGTRRRLEARLNGGGPPIRLEGTNGGIRIGAR
jgi:putative adhesin